VAGTKTMTGAGTGTKTKRVAGDCDRDWDLHWDRD